MKFSTTNCLSSKKKTSGTIPKKDDRRQGELPGTVPSRRLSLQRRKSINTLLGSLIVYLVATTGGGGVFRQWNIVDALALSQPVSVDGANHTYSSCYICSDTINEHGQRTDDEELSRMFPSDHNVPPCETGKEEIRHCPPEHFGCLTKFRGNEMVKACSPVAINSCHPVNEVRYCYCIGNLCNNQVKGTQVQEEDKRKVKSHGKNMNSHGLYTEAVGTEVSLNAHDVNNDDEDGEDYDLVDGSGFGHNNNENTGGSSNKKDVKISSHQASNITSNIKKGASSAGILAPNWFIFNRFLFTIVVLLF